MKELLEIIKTYKQAGSAVALATIVQTAGSSYRRAGARMLILPDGRTVGCISGGCLDQDVVLHGQNVIKTQKPFLITYDTSSDQDIILGVGLGCKGVIDILVEYMPPAAIVKNSGSNLLNFLDESLHGRSTVTAATVIQTTGETGLNMGDRVTRADNAQDVADSGSKFSADILGKYLRDALDSSGPQMIAHETPTGSARIFVESFLPQRQLVILGAGHDAMPLSRLADELGFRVTVVDAREGYVSRERFPLASELVIARPEDNDHCQLFDEHTVAVIMSHNYLIDQAWLANLLPLGLPYLGLMGPRKRAEKMLSELREKEFEIGEDDLSALHNPIGLDIGAETPEQIALAILAEIQTVLAGRDGGKLRQKKGSIHLAPRKTSSGVLIFEQMRETSSCPTSA